MHCRYFGFDLFCVLEYHHLKASMRQRFSIFVINANYTYYHGMSDQEDRRGVKYYLPVDNYALYKEWAIQ
jgi:hypothetical protein